MTFVRSAPRILALSTMLAATLYGSSAGAQGAVPAQCTYGTIIFAESATHDRSNAGLKPGTLFSDSGHFAEHGADEPCDPGKTLGPFNVDASASLRLNLTGGPPVKPVWSIYNSGVGVSVSFQPQLGSGFGAARSVAQVVLAPGETEAEITGSWVGPGRLWVHVGAPRGSGPLTMSCFEQSYSATGEIIEVETVASARPGQSIGYGDTIETQADGRVLIRGSNIVIPGDSSMFFGTGPTTVREGTADIVSGELPDYWNADLDRVEKLVRGFWSKGYPKPDQTDLNTYGSLDLEYLNARLAAIPDQCKAAVFAKLYLDANQDDLNPLTAAQVGYGLLKIKMLPNEFDFANKLIKLAMKKSVPILGQASLALNLISAYDVMKKFSDGTSAGWKGRWGLKAYERAQSEGWGVDRIRAERRLRHVESEMLLAEINRLRVEMREKAEQRTAQYQRRRAEIKADLVREVEAIAADEAVDGETTRRQAWLDAHPDWARPGVYYRPGEVIADRTPLEQARQQYLSEAVDHYRKARTDAMISAGALKVAAWTNLKKDLRLIGRRFNQRIADKLGKMARLYAENDALKKFAEPIASGECEKLRKPPAAGDTCPPREINILGGGLRYWSGHAEREVIGTLKNLTISRLARWTMGELNINLNGFRVKPKGTDFEAEMTEAGGVVRVFEGQVMMESPSGRRLALGAGQTVDLPAGTVADLPEGAGAMPQLHGLDIRDIPIDADRPAPHGVFALTLEDGVPGNGWTWQDPGDDASIGPAEEPGTIIVNVPDGNELWAGQATAPRLLHKVTGDFDLSLSMNLSLPDPAGHFAVSEFVLYSPGQQIGVLAGQASGPTAPGADYRLMNGAWARFDGRTTLPVWGRKDGFEPPPDAMVRLRFSRRGDWFFSLWSLDGEIWTLGTRNRVEVPRTVWTGLAFKRVAHDGQRETPAVTTLREVALASDLPGALPTEGLLPGQADGRVRPLLDGWLMEHDPERMGEVMLTTALPLPGDFDAVVRVDLGGAHPAAGQGAAVRLEIVGETRDAAAYVALSTSAGQGGRYQTDQGIDGTWGEYDWHHTSDGGGWIRLIRRDGYVRAFFWRLGEWIELRSFGRQQPDPMFLGVASHNHWGGTAPMAFSPVVVIERIATGDNVGADYAPAGYSLMTEEPQPNLRLPQTVEARLFTAPHVIQAPFFDPQGNLYLLGAEQKTDRLIRLDPEGVSGLAGVGEVFLGRNRKRGLWIGGQLFITIDSWPEGGTLLWGLNRVGKDGTASPVPLNPGLGGLACLKRLAGDSVMMCDFEYDGLWKLPIVGGEAVNLMTTPLACPQDAAVSGATGSIMIVNNGQSYSCDGNPGLFRLDAAGEPALVLTPQAGGELGGVVWAPEGPFGKGFLVVDTASGSLIRVDERAGETETVLSGLSGPGDLAVSEDGHNLAVVLEGRQILVLRPRHLGQ